MRAAVKGLPIVGPPATAMAARVPSWHRIRRLPADARWLASAVVTWRPGSARRAAVIVTGSDSSHFRSQLNMLASVGVFEAGTPVSFWDLGLEESERNELRSRFPNVRITRFPYEDYPAHFDITQSAGQYAWKPVIVEQEVRRNPSSIVVWLDAGDLVDRRLRWLRRFVHAAGFFSPLNGPSVKEWTHPATLDYLKADPSLLERENLNGAVVAVDATNPRARALVERWASCARTRECIAPPGSDRSNHRQDQAVLTVLAHQAGLAPRGRRGELFPLLGILVHQDVD